MQAMYRATQLPVLYMACIQRLQKKGCVQFMEYWKQMRRGGIRHDRSDASEGLYCTNMHLHTPIGTEIYNWSATDHLLHFLIE